MRWKLGLAIQLLQSMLCNVNYFFCASLSLSLYVTLLIKSFHSSLPFLLSFSCALLHTLFITIKVNHYRYIEAIANIWYQSMKLFFIAIRNFFCLLKVVTLFCKNDTQSITIFWFMKKCRFTKSSRHYIIVFLSLRTHKAWKHEILTFLLRVTIIFWFLAKELC